MNLLRKRALRFHSIKVIKILFRVLEREVLDVGFGRDFDPLSF